VVGGQKGKLLESSVAKTSGKQAALTFIKTALKGHGSPEAITTDGLRSYGVAIKNELGYVREEGSARPRRQRSGQKEGIILRRLGSIEHFERGRRLKNNELLSHPLFHRCRSLIKPRRN
jgi:putative transposase